MKRIINWIMVMTSCSILLSCAPSAHQKISAVTDGSFEGQDLTTTLTALQSREVYCQRSHKEESDTRLTSITDGTLKDVKFYLCFAEGGANLFGVSRNMTVLIAQYEKVLRIHGNVSASSYIWH